MLTLSSLKPFALSNMLIAMVLGTLCKPHWGSVWMVSSFQTPPHISIMSIILDQTKFLDVNLHSFITINWFFNITSRKHYHLHPSKPPHILNYNDAGLTSTRQHTLRICSLYVFILVLNLKQTSQWVKIPCNSQKLRHPLYIILNLSMPYFLYLKMSFNLFRNCLSSLYVHSVLNKSDSSCGKQDKRQTTIKGCLTFMLTSLSDLTFMSTSISDDSK